MNAENNLLGMVVLLFSMFFITVSYAQSYELKVLLNTQNLAPCECNDKLNL